MPVEFAAEELIRLARALNSIVADALDELRHRQREPMTHQVASGFTADFRERRRKSPISERAVVPCFRDDQVWVNLRENRLPFAIFLREHSGYEGSHILGVF